MIYQEMLDTGGYKLIRVISDEAPKKYNHCGYEIWKKGSVIQSCNWGSCGWTFIKLSNAIEFLNNKIKK